MITQTTLNLPDSASIVELLGNPALNLRRTTAEELLADQNIIAYNPAVAAEKINRYKALNADFYLGEIEYGSPAIYAHYNGDGIRFFAKIDLFSSMLSNAGFRMASLFETSQGVIVYFSDINGGRAANTEANRRLFRQQSEFLTLTTL